MRYALVAAAVGGGAFALLLRRRTIRVYTAPGGGHVCLGPYSVAFNTGRDGGRYVNGSRYCSGLHRWRT